ncbi:hypothetical protein E4U36_000338 [Claviceps purpurea]|nr:hypothetical protein E4U37_001844 [Claviceps purpurea]KAG6186777.1 hypothetical protein E4U36_000338 [Claviceps purpurea]KAG6227519.1 hypothetical protein E4U26_001623 [Claviceps purpurea]KAG6310778.1 hypothetical protein E4U44_005064 [Claviceps purpurea]
MSLKRSFADVESQDHNGTPSSATHHGKSSYPKRQKQYGTGIQKAKEDRASFAKKRIRTIARLLQRNTDLPAHVQNDLQRELATLKTTVADKSIHKRRSAMISKYHMVRFFERKKASRLVKQLKRKIEQSPDSDDVENLKRQLHIAEVDEAYTIYHPHLEPYRSLYGNVKADSKGRQDGEDSEEAEEEAKNDAPIAKKALDTERPSMWSVVEKTMKQGLEALQQLRERRPDDLSVSATKPPRATKNPAHSKQDTSKQDPAGRDAAVKSNHDAKKEAKTTIPSGRTQTGEKTPLNRRERRRLMREAEAEKDSDDEAEGGGFFEGL